MEDEDEGVRVEMEDYRGGFFSGFGRRCWGLVRGRG